MKVIDDFVEAAMGQMDELAKVAPELIPGMRQAVRGAAEVAVAAAGQEVRFMAARAAMQGLLAGTDMRYVVSGPGGSRLREAAERTAADAVAFADALITALDAPKTTEPAKGEE